MVDVESLFSLQNVRDFIICLALSVIYICILIGCIKSTAYLRREINRIKQITRLKHDHYYNLNNLIQNRNKEKILQNNIREKVKKNIQELNNKEKKNK